MFIQKMFANWSEEEDRLLEEVLTGEPKKAIIWSVITFRLNKLGCKKTLKEIKSRYIERSQLRKKDQNWSKDNLKKIFNYYLEFGSQWTIIASKFKGQTDNTVKNRFFSLLRKALRKMVRLLRNKLNISYTKIINQIKPKVLTTLLERTITLETEKGNEKMEIIDIVKEFSFNEIDEMTQEEIKEKYPIVVKVVDLAMSMNEMYKENKSIIHSRYELEYDNCRNDNERNIDNFVKKDNRVNESYYTQQRNKKEKAIITEFKEEVRGLLSKAKILNNDLDYMGFSNITEIDDKLAEVFNSKVGELLDLSMNLRTAFYKNKKSASIVKNHSEEFNENSDNSSSEPEKEKEEISRSYIGAGINRIANKQFEHHKAIEPQQKLIKNISIEVNNNQGEPSSLLAKRFNMSGINMRNEEEMNQEPRKQQTNTVLAKRDRPFVSYSILKYNKKEPIDEYKTRETKRVKVEDDDEIKRQQSWFNIIPRRNDSFKREPPVSQFHIPAPQMEFTIPKLKQPLSYPSFLSRNQVVQPEVPEYYDPVLNDKTKRYSIQFALHEGEISFINAERTFTDKRAEEATINIMDPIEGGEFVYKLN